MGADNHPTVVPRNADQNRAETDRPMKDWDIVRLQSEGSRHAQRAGVTAACVAAEARRELRRRGMSPDF